MFIKSHIKGAVIVSPACLSGQSVTGLRQGGGAEAGSGWGLLTSQLAVRHVCVWGPLKVPPHPGQGPGEAPWGVWSPPQTRMHLS